MAKKKNETEEMEEMKEACTENSKKAASAEAKKEKEEKEEEESTPTQAEKELEETKKSLAELEDRYLRTLAEYDNFKKRSAKEKEDLYFASKADVIKKLLPVFDNLDRAQMCPEGEDYRKGVEMVLNQFGEILKALEIESVAKEGDAFDPAFHEAIFREEKEGVPENTVTEVLQKGYAIGDKVIRHAMVKVSG